MKKRLLSLIMAAIMMCGILPVSASAAGYSNFKPTLSYFGFTDVSSSDWYAENVRAAYQLGLIEGKSGNRFDPDANLTLAEAVKLAAVLHSIYMDGVSDFPSEQPWYAPYVEYAHENGILKSDFVNYTAEATRAQFATLFAAALPKEAYEVINDVEDGAIPDVAASSLYADAVYKLYRAGILTGSDAAGSFKPASSIRRSEVAAIVTRMADPTLRRSITLLKQDAPDPVTTPSGLTSEQVFEQCSPAVFYIEVYNNSGRAIGSGSGVFLSEEGEAMTNYHVIEGASSARIRTTDGRVYDVSGVYDFNDSRDLARIQVAGSGFTSLQMSETVNTGATVYAIGSPLGLENTISNGIVSAASRTVNGKEYIQTTASISHGSSGGALIDTNGKLIGITAAYIDGGQNLNLAIPVKYFSSLASEKVQTFSEMLQSNAKIVEYSNFPTVPDFGYYSGAPLSDVNTDDGTTVYTYYASDITTGSLDDTLNGYAELMQENGFTFYSKSIKGNITQYSYVNNTTRLMVAIAMSPVTGDVLVMIGLGYY